MPPDIMGLLSTQLFNPVLKLMNKACCKRYFSHREHREHREKISNYFVNLCGLSALCEI